MKKIEIEVGDRVKINWRRLTEESKNRCKEHGFYGGREYAVTHIDLSTFGAGIRIEDGDNFVFVHNPDLLTLVSKNKQMQDFKKLLKEHGI